MKIIKYKCLLIISNFKHCITLISTWLADQTTILPTIRFSFLILLLHFSCIEMSYPLHSYSVSLFVFVWGYTISARGYYWLCTRKSFLPVSGDYAGMLGIESGSTMTKGNALPAVLSLLTSLTRFSHVYLPEFNCSNSHFPVNYISPFQFTIHTNGIGCINSSL